MKTFGYYYARGKYGNYDHVDDFTNTDLLTPTHFDRFTGFPETDEVILARLKREAKRSLRKGRSITLGLDIKDGYPWRRVISRVIKPFTSGELAGKSCWDNVDLIDLSDEPSWNEGLQTSMANEVRGEIESQNRDPFTKRLGAVFAYTAPVRKVSQALDWVGFEAYLAGPGTQYPSIAKAIRDQLKYQAGRIISSAHEVVIVLQSYDRNGNWTEAKKLRELQHETILASKEIFGDSVIGYLMFAYGRPGGVVKYPGLEVIHRQIWEEEIK